MHAKKWKRREIRNHLSVVALVGFLPYQPMEHFTDTQQIICYVENDELVFPAARRRWQSEQYIHGIRVAVFLIYLTSAVRACFC